MPPTARTTATGQPDRPPVPLNVLLPTGFTGTDDPAGLTPSTAAHLVGVYTQPGALVVDLHGTGILATAAAQAGRRATTLVTTSYHRDHIQTRIEAGLEPTRRALARTLTVPTADMPAVLAGSPGRIRLLMTRLPAEPPATVDLRATSRWLGACRTALADGGWLLAAVDPVGAGDIYRDHLTTVVVAARAIGLTYHQHLVLPIRPLPEHDEVPRRQAPGPRPRRHHVDVLVFLNGGTHHA